MAYNAHVNVCIKDEIDQTNFEFSGIRLNFKTYSTHFELPQTAQTFYWQLYHDQLPHYLGGPELYKLALLMKGQ